MAGLFLVLSGIVLVAGASRTRSDLSPKRVRLFGVVTAGIFVAQMLNWPIPGGTSAHLVGGALAAIVLGPHLGALAVALVLIVQAFVFGDGGIFALGANIWNMAIVEAYAGYAVYQAFSDRNRPLAVVAAGWIGITLAALFAGLQLGLSPAFDYQLQLVLTVMVGGHLLLGIGEGLLTWFGTRLILGTAIETDTGGGGAEPAMTRSIRSLVGRTWFQQSIGGLLTLVVLTPVFAWAAEYVAYAEPLDNAAALTGAATEIVAINYGLLPGYTIPGLGPRVGVFVAGFVGTAITLGMALESGRRLSLH